MVFDGVLTSSDLESGLFALLDITPEEHADNRTIPNTPTSFTFGKLNLKRFWRNLPALLQGAPPEKAAATAGAIALFQQRSGLDIEHDLLAPMGDRYSLSTAMVGTNQTMVLAWELTDGAAMESAISRLLASPLVGQWAQLIETSEYRGHTLFSLKNTKNPGTGPALCATPDWLILGLKADLTRELVLNMDRATPPPPSPLESGARAHASADAFGFGGMNHRKTSGLLKISVSDSSFSAGLGFSSKLKKEEAAEPGENEISLHYLATFLGNTYHFAEAVPGGVHHRLVFENANHKGPIP